MENGHLEKETIKIDEFHWHEALDRSWTLAVLYEELLRDHPVIEKYFSEQAEEVGGVLFKFHQVIGKLLHETWDKRKDA
jgi:hypothetical protein